ncbi:hypothetical protein H2201_000784 [Coniosporium apollinis]|uniref:Nephrocystin 3-like N-terminal domain-containing protein n=1 Tax=Coniosporium apollinis TaxID=61459 RepID=A0ABQ9P4E4_9PEZI|nr:hypothetical protein H2201_000784 [Coniosporium apollinis]
MESENASGLQAPKEPSVKGLSVLVNPDRPALDIVFVHGFTGHPERTWSHKGELCDDRHEHDDGDVERPSKFRRLLPSTSSNHRRSGVRKAVYWPRDLVPTTVPDARILTYGYDTHIRHRFGPAVSSSTVYDIAWDFLVSLEAERRSESSRPLLFIAHSLGGIVVKEALRRSRGCETYQNHIHTIYESTSGIIFFGTPHGGADPRGLLQHIAERVIRAAGFTVNEQIVNTLLPSSERLRELREEFGPMNNMESKLSAVTSGPDDVEYGKVVAALDRVRKATARLAPTGVRPVLNPDDRSSYLDSLKFDRIDARHATIKTAHAKTCKWLLKMSEYQDWRDVTKISEHHGFLWIKGKPGTGKSTIMKFAYANAKKTMTDTIIISFFFNARGEHLEKSVEGMYRSLLFQLLEKLPDLQIVFDSLESMVPNRGDVYRWDIEQLKNLFGSAIEKIGRRNLTCFIDALDECEEDQVREMVAFFEHLGQLAVSSQIRFSVCFSSRHYPHISIEKSVELVLEGQEGHRQDMANYLHSELKAGRGKLIEEIKAEILKRASGIFLWVVLVVQMLNKEYDRGRIHALRKRLDEIPSGLDELFKDILTRDGENIAELILCLQWVLFAKRPLKREELYFAVLAGVESDPVVAWNPEEITNEVMERFILSSSKGLAEVTKSKDQTVQFIHESVRDFLLKGNGLNTLRSELSSSFLGLGHERLKQCCEKYIRINLSEHVPLTEPLPTASSEEAANLRRLVSGKFPFLEYAVWHVLYHADAAVGHGVSQDSFVEQFPLGEWISLDNLFERYQIRRHTSNASLLYILAEENLPNLIQIEIKRVPHMDIKGERYGFPILAALANENKNAMEALLMPYDNAGPDNDMPHDQPSYSTARDREEAIEYLLGNGRNICSQKELTKGHQTLLFWAAAEGAHVVVMVLFATRKVDIDSKGRDREMLLWIAAGRGYEAVVKLLLARADVDVNSKNMDGRTLLWIAVEQGHEAVVKLLLARADVDANIRGGYSEETPLWIAVERGHEAVVKLLLARADVDVNSKKRGHKAVVKLLLARADVDVNSKNMDGYTPLWIAVERGHEAVVKLLLARVDVNVNLIATYGRTPLWIAAGRGYKVVVKLLLARADVDVNIRGGYSEETPLWIAAERGHEAVVKLLLARADVDVNSKNMDEYTPLWIAVERGHEAVVKLLLARADIDVNSKNMDGRTPLWIAAERGHEAVVKLLLAHADVDANIRGGYSEETPLWIAVERGHEAVVMLLQSYSAVS